MFIIENDYINNERILETLGLDSNPLYGQGRSASIFIQHLLLSKEDSGAI